MRCVVSNPSKPLLSLDMILGAKDQVTKDLDAPEWGGVLRVRQLSAFEGMNLGKVLAQTKQGSNMKILQACAINEEGQLLFKNEQQMQQFAQKNLKVVNRLAEEAAVFIGIAVQPPKRADELVEELKKIYYSEDGQPNEFATAKDLMDAAEAFVRPEESVKNA